VATLQGVSTKVGQTVDLVKNITQVVNALGAVTTKLTAATAPPFQLTANDQAYCYQWIADHHFGHNHNPAPDVTTTYAAEVAYDATCPIVTFLPGTNELWVICQVRGLWTATGGGTDTPHMYTSLYGQQYGLRDYWAICSPDTFVTATPTDTYITMVCHFSRNLAYAGENTMQIHTSFDLRGTGTWTTNANSWGQIMSSAAPYLDDIPPVL
jgi:hypothetical protein